MARSLVATHNALDDARGNAEAVLAMVDRGFVANLA